MKIVHPGREIRVITLKPPLKTFTTSADTPMATTANISMATNADSSETTTAGDSHIDANDGCKKCLNWLAILQLTIVPTTSLKNKTCNSVL